MPDFNRNTGNRSSYGSNRNNRGPSGNGRNNYGGNNGRRETQPTRVFAPYNFVPFPKNPAYIKDESEIIGQNVMADKAEDGEPIYSGEIRYSLQAMTAVFVDDGTKEHRFCRNAAGEFIIPGSTMRGLIRSHAMTLGLGNVRDEIEDYSLMFRDVANGLEKRRYSTILGSEIARFTNNKGDEYTLSVLKNVRAGYIEKKANGKYVIYKTELDPVNEDDPAIDQKLGKMNYYTVNERIIIEQYLDSESKYKKDPDSFSYSFLIPDIQNEMMNQTAHFREEYDRSGNKSYIGRNNFSYIPYHKKVAYSLRGSRYVDKLKSPSAADTDPALLRGTLVSTGYMQKKKVIYVIPDIDHFGENGSPRVAVELPDKDVRDFQVDYNRRKNSIALNRNNPNRNRKTEEYKSYFNLPTTVGEKGRKPVFYIELGGRCYFGFTPRLRLFYDHTVAEGIEKTHVKGKVDLVKAIFGYISEGRNSAKGTNARKTRVSFSDAVFYKSTAPGSQAELGPRYLALSEPRPTDYYNYLEQGDRKSSYNDRNLRLRGAKQYWLHRENEPGIREGEQNEKMDSLLHPLDKGSCFRGTIRFKNLRKYELGLLLWSIRLEEESWMNLGKGKAYGYGAMKLTELKARSVEYSKAYDISGASPALFGNLYKELDIAELIDYYKFFIKKYNGDRSIDQLPLIEDFFAMKDSTRIPPREKTGYMSLTEFQDQKRSMAPLPKVSDVAAERGNGGAVSSTGASSAPQSRERSAEEEKIQKVLFLAGYDLSDSQRQKLESMSGLPVVAIKEWADDNNITQYSKKYHSIALPSFVKATVLNTCKKNCVHVYQATKNKNEKVDSGWKCLQ